MPIRAVLLVLLLSVPVQAQGVADMTSRPGWEVFATQKSFATLVDAVRAAAGRAGLAVVTMAGPTDAAARRGVEIPGNRVIGLFNNDYAVRLLRLSTPAMIEAPLRVYVTENADGTATLSYIRPSERLAPYASERPAIGEIASELDAAFAAVAADAIR